MSGCSKGGKEEDLLFAELDLVELDIIKIVSPLSGVVVDTTLKNRRPHSHSIRKRFEKQDPQHYDEKRFEKQEDLYLLMRTCNMINPSLSVAPVAKSDEIVDPICVASLDSRREEHRYFLTTSRVPPDRENYIRDRTLT